MSDSNNFQDSNSSEGRYRLLVESISDYAIFMLDPSGIVTNWNAGAQRFKGYTAQEIVGQNFSRFYAEEERAAGTPARNLARAASEGRYEEEGWRIRKDGSRFWAHVIIDRIVDPSGKLVGFAKITRDLTERREQELALRRTQEQFRLLVKGVTDYALYMLDPDGRIESWNAGAEHIHGYSEAEVLGRHFSMFYIEEERNRGEADRNLSIARDKGSIELEGWRLRKDGSRFWAHVVIDALHDDSGALIGYAKVTQDITERRESQLQLDLAREALFQAQKLEAIGQLTGGVAHDFNNLLMAILGSLEIVQRRLSPDPRIAPFIENAVSAAQRGAALTQRMLTFARRQELQMGTVDLLETTRGMSDILERALGPTVYVTTRFPLSLPKVRTDKAQLESALLNLAVNARDAMPKGGPLILAAAEITVSPGNPTVRPGNPDKMEPGHYVVLSVSDSGTGMDDQTLARATEPFFTTKGPGKGTGLGLSMVYGLAKQSGGTLVLTSKPGMGTKAELWLPVGTGEATAPVASSPAEPAIKSPAAKTILVVDDDALVLLNTVTMAEELGHTVYDATSGQAALKILKEKRVDLVVTDYAMPQMTGGELATGINAQWPSVKILIATGYSEMPPEYKGTFNRLNKPFSAQDLQAAIDRVA